MVYGTGHIAAMPLQQICYRSICYGIEMHNSKVSGPDDTIGLSWNIYIICLGLSSHVILYVHVHFIPLIQLFKA